MIISFYEKKGYYFSGWEFKDPSRSSGVYKDSTLKNLGQLKCAADSDTCHALLANNRCHLSGRRSLYRDRLFTFFLLRPHFESTRMAHTVMHSSLHMECRYIAFHVQGLPISLTFTSTSTIYLLWGGAGVSTV